MMKKTIYVKKLVGPLAAAIAAAGIFSLGLSGCDDSQAKPVPATQGAPVSTAVVIEKAITETQEFSGRMEAIERVEIRARVGGFITKVDIAPGHIIKKGDVLFVIDPRPYQAELNRTEAAAAAARAKVELAKIELTRAERLYAEKAIPQRELDTSSSGFKELNANARAAEAQYENAKLNLSYTRVTSPINGRVGKAEITVGNLVDSSTMLTTVVSDDKIYASFDGDEDTLLRVGAAAHSGKRINVKIGLANETGYPHDGKLEFVDNQLDPQTGAVRMRAVFDNADKKLVPGLFARVQLQGGNGNTEKTRALMINDRAVGTDQSRKFVYIVTADNKAEYRLVTLGQTVDGMRVVREGLKAGDKIVVNGLQRVHQGAALAPHMVSMDFDPNAPAAAEAAVKPDETAKAATDTPAKG
jgi:multidrug efflux system membrane fusion protein